MKPTWQIIEGDNLEAMRGMADKSASVCITDPPYSSETHDGARKAGRPPGRGKNGQRLLYSTPDKLVDFNHISLADLRLRFDEIGRITRRWTVATMDYKHIVSLEAEPPKAMRFVRFGIWIKPDGSPQFTGDRPGMGWEGVAHLHRLDEPMRWHGGGHHGTYTHNTNKSGLYPTMKPESLIREFVTLFTDEGDTVIDPFCGSGQVGVVCVQMGRNFIGIDSDPYACELARARISRATGEYALLPPRRNIKDRKTPLLDALLLSSAG